MTAILCFVAAVWMAARVLQQVLPGRQWIAVAGASVAMMHPVFAEIVPFVTTREETLSVALGLAAILVFMRSRAAARSSPAFACLLGLALLVKESSVVFVALAAAHDLVYGRLRPWRDGFRRDLAIWWPALGVLAGYFALRWIAFGDFLGGDGSQPDFLSWKALRFHTHFFASLGDPTLLSVGSLRGGAPIAALLFAAPVVAVLCFWGRVPTTRRRDLLYVGPVWYLVSVVLYTGIPFSTRHHILPILGLVMLVSVSLGTLVDLGVLRRERRVAIAMLAIGAMAFLPVSIQTSREYQTASRVVEEVRGRIESELSELPFMSRVVLASVPQMDLPPYYFGWGLRSALSHPFTPSDAWNRFVILNQRYRELNNIDSGLPAKIDHTINVGANDSIPDWIKERYLSRAMRESSQ
jgi:hypothetical protein